MKLISEKTLDKFIIVVILIIMEIWIKT